MFVSKPLVEYITHNTTKQILRNNIRIAALDVDIVGKIRYPGTYTAMSPLDVGVQTQGAKSVMGRSEQALYLVEPSFTTTIGNLFYSSYSP